MIFIIVILRVLIMMMILVMMMITTMSIVLTMIIIIPMIYFGIFMAVFMVFSSYNDGTYDKCMKECVLPDESNYNECSLSTCDFPI